jgi:hypothetical protein
MIYTRSGQELLELVKRLLSLGCPHEPVSFPQKPVKGETSFAEA